MVMDYCIRDIFGRGKIRVSTNKHTHIFVVVIDNTPCTKINTIRREQIQRKAFIIIYSNRLYCFQIYYFEIYGVKRRVWEPGFPLEKKIESKSVV
jgi:hypothetical protein